MLRDRKEHHYNPDFFTVMKTFDNRTVIIPNSKLSNEVIINLSREGKRRMDIELKFGFGVDFQAVKSVIEKSIEGVAGLLTEPVSRIGVLTVDADGYRAVLIVWAPAHGFLDMKLILQEKIINNLKQGGKIGA